MLRCVVLCCVALCCVCVCACCGHAGVGATCVRVQVCLPGFDFCGRNSPKVAESLGMKLATSCKKTLRDGPGRGN